MKELWFANSVAMNTTQQLMHGSLTKFRYTATEDEARMEVDVVHTWATYWAQKRGR